MNDKPSFRDFIRAYRLSDIKEDQLYIFNRETGKRALYNKPPTWYGWQFAGAGIALVICAAAAVPWFINRDSVLFLSSTLPELLFFMYFVSRFIGNAVINKFVYYRMDFEKISETDWDDTKESEYRKSKFWGMRFPWILMASLYIFMILAIGFTPVYVRYLADRALGTPFKAEVVIYTSDGVLERTNIYINGEDTGLKSDYIGEITGQFWSDRYFEIFQSGHIIFKPVEGRNTLELKSDSFYKKWTFTLIFY